MACLNQNEETNRHDVRKRQKSKYRFMGRDVCLGAFLYLEHTTLHQVWSSCIQTVSVVFFKYERQYQISSDGSSHDSLVPISIFSQKRFGITNDSQVNSNIRFTVVYRFCALSRFRALYVCWRR